MGGGRVSPHGPAAAGDASRATKTREGKWHLYLPGHVAQSVTCLITIASLTTDPGVANFDPVPVPYFLGD